MGSGEWAVEAEVTHVCYSDYRCVGNVPDEPLCGACITGNYYITSRSPRAGKMNQTLLWLLERERKRYLACGIIRGTNRDYPLSRKKNFSDSSVINLSSATLVRSRWLNIGFVLFFPFFCVFLFINTQKIRPIPAILTSGTRLVNNPYLSLTFQFMLQHFYTTTTSFLC